MPNVPKLPGVPPLASYLADPIVLMVADLVGSFFGAGAAQWGIFLNGAPVIEFDSTIAFEFRQDLPVPDYPVEEGGFQSYNKVQLPQDIRVRLSTGGSIAKRQRFLQSIDEVINTLELYDVVTPEVVYLGFNFTHRDFRRTAEAGNGLIVVDLWMTEIRETSTATFSGTQTPQGAGQQNTGNVQPQTPNAIIFDGFGLGGWGVQ